MYSYRAGMLRWGDSFVGSWGWRPEGASIALTFRDAFHDATTAITREGRPFNIVRRSGFNVHSQNKLFWLRPSSRPPLFKPRDGRLLTKSSTETKNIYFTIDCFHALTQNYFSEPTSWFLLLKLLELLQLTCQGPQKFFMSMLGWCFSNTTRAE
jgi:hypothetical protein